MSRSADRPRGLATRAVHTPAPPVPAERPLGLPVHRTAAFAFDSAEDYSDILNDRVPGYSYSRVDNPTVDAFASAVAALEGAPAGQGFASGMAAISTTLLSLVSAGDHVVAQAHLYGGTYSVLRHVVQRFAVETTLVDPTDPDAAAAAIRPETRLIWAETISNPSLVVADLPGLAALARESGVPLVVDSTFASPAICRPLEWGADLVVHSATKYIGGHSDVTGGVVVGDPDLLHAVRALRIDLGGALAPDEAFLLHRGLATLPLRMERHCANAQAFAEAMAGHPRVERLTYPGLAGNPQHELAQKLFDARPGTGTLFGGMVTIVPRGGRAAGMAMCNNLQLVHIASSLGGVSTKVSHAASTTHRQLDDSALEAAGIAPGAVRFSLGLEDVDDVIEDVSRALDALR